MGLVQDMAPVVKTLQEAHEASLLYGEDEDATVESASDCGEHEVDEPLRPGPKAKPNSIKFDFRATLERRLI